MGLSNSTNSNGDNSNKTGWQVKKNANTGRFTEDRAIGNSKQQQQPPHTKAVKSSVPGKDKGGK